MNIFFIPLMQMFEGAGGLFDFNATLPIMALQFILLTVVLTFVFYKPVAKVIEDRDTMINNNLTEASAKLLKADQLYKQYDEQLKSARSNAQLIIAESENEAKEIVAEEISKAKEDASKLIQQTNKELEAQKALALQKLETQVDELSDLIKDKLLAN
jgi:F-type H+-transporting ATPase subunit b